MTLKEKPIEKTAMQLAIEHYEDLSLNGSNQAYVIAKFLKDNFLEIEKQQIIDAVGFGQNNHTVSINCDKKLAEDYYNQKFKSE